MKTLLVTLFTVLATANISACSADADDDDSGKKTSPIGAEGTSEQSSTCPEVMLPPASACENGTWVEEKNAAGCTTKFNCVACPAVAAPPAGFCPGGNVVETKNEAGCVTGFDCVACPAVMAPPASACEGGTWVEKKNTAGCVTGFDCVK
ncbi:MAG: hypothetical protein K0S65_2382 [Labilithrix sp.]|nr:hypothetical protein [Labilithrix sp.]